MARTRRVRDIDSLGCENLAYAIVHRAVLDYKNAVRCNSKVKRDALRQFFNSRLYNSMCDVLGDLVVMEIERSMIDERKRRQRGGAIGRPVRCTSIVDGSIVVYPSVIGAATGMDVTDSTIYHALHKDRKCPTGILRGWLIEYEHKDKTKGL